MFEVLGEAVDELEIPADGDALVEVFAIVHRLHSKVIAAVGAFDHAGLWDLDGATSMTAWIKTRCSRSGPDAARWVSRAKRLRRLPTTASAALTPVQVDIILANVKARHLELFSQHETDLVPTLVGLSVEETAQVMEAWRERAEHDDELPPEETRELHCSRTLDGRRVVKGHFDGEGGGLLETALRLATTEDQDGEPVRTPGVRRGDALIDICRFFLDHQQTRKGGRHRPHLNVILDLDALEQRGQGRLIDGTVLGETSIQRLLCDANLHRIVIDGKSAILDYGTTVHTVPAHLYNAVVVRDRRCRWPGCDRPPKWCEAHHIWHWNRGGPTRLDNLVLCSVPATTTGSTAPAGTPNSHPTATSRSPTPTAGCTSANHPSAAPTAHRATGVQHTGLAAASASSPQDDARITRPRPHASTRPAMWLTSATDPAHAAGL